MIPIIKQNERMCHKKELGNVEGNRLTTEMLIPTSGTQCCEQMPQEEYCNAVSQSCVSQGKVGGKCLKHPEPNQGTQQQCCSRKASGFQEQERQGHTIISFRNQHGTTCRGIRPASNSVHTKARENSPAGTHVSHHV